MTQSDLGRKGQSPNVVPHNFPFNEEAIKGYMDTNLPDGVLVENIVALTELNYIEKAGPGKYKIIYPVAELT